MSHILIVDDEPAICWAFRECLTDEGFSVDVAGTGEQAMTMADRRAPDVIVMDVRLPGIDGLQAMQHFRRKSISVPIIIMTAFGSLKTAVNAIDGGAFDYLTKPIDLENAISVVRQAISASTKIARPEMVEMDDEFIVGSSAPMQEVFRKIALVAERDVPVLITGESGTGKDLVAQAIHQHSRRRGGFVPICIPALSESVVESELFGHVRGAFTGADQARCGLLELADGGTAFIDEIGDVPLNLQAKLLRVLETGELRPVGESDCRVASFRLIAATNRILEQRVADGEFRSDLFYRLNVFRIELPSLRDRLDDIPALADRFLLNLSGDDGRRLRISPEAVQELQSRAWYGNVRELRNVLESASVICRGDTIGTEHLPAPVSSLVCTPPASAQSVADQLTIAVQAWTKTQLEERGPACSDLYEKFLKAVEPRLIESALKHVSGQRGEAAKLLGDHRETLREKLRRLDEERS
ncbi:MAG: sigma-54 dependent transcriptional regulator [Planctomycetaceae bacterium]